MRSRSSRRPGLEVVLAVLVAVLTVALPATASDSSSVAVGDASAPTGSDPDDALPLPEGEQRVPARVGDTVWFGFTLQENQVARIQVGASPTDGSGQEVLRDVTLRLSSTRPDRLAARPCTRNEGPASDEVGHRTQLGTRRAQLNVKRGVCDGFGRHLFAVQLAGSGDRSVELTVVASIIGSPEPVASPAPGSVSTDRVHDGGGPPTATQAPEATPSASAGSPIVTILGALSVIGVTLVVAARRRARSAGGGGEDPGDPGDDRRGPQIVRS